MDSVSVCRSINGKRKIDDHADAGYPHLQFSARSHDDEQETEKNVDNFLTNADQKLVTEKNEEEELLGCETPKSEEHLIPDIIHCPPPPKKSRPTRPSWISKSATSTPPGGFFIVPHDFDLLFIPRKKTVRPAKRLRRPSLRIEFPQPSGDHRI